MASRYLPNNNIIQELIQTRQSPRAKWLKAFMINPTNAPEMQQLEGIR